MPWPPRYSPLPGDNREHDHPRPSDVQETQWEAELRRCLAERAGQAPAPRADLATVALTRGRRIRRRRNLAGVVAVVVATMAIAGGFPEAWRDGSGGSGLRPVTEVIGDPDRVARPSPSEASPAPQLVDPDLPGLLEVELLTVTASGETVLAAPDGHVTELPELGAVQSAHRVDAGLAVVAGSPGRLRLWWVEPDQPPVTLLVGMDAIVVHQDRVAWQRGTSLASAVLVDGALTERVMTLLPEPDIELAGLAESTVVVRTAASKTVTWDVWYPERGDYLPTWEPRIRWIYGPVGDSDQLLGLVTPEQAPTGAGDYCLAWWKLDAEAGPDLATAQTRCPSITWADPGLGTVSPDGRWLVAAAADGVVLMDLPALAAGTDEEHEAVTTLPEKIELIAAPIWLSREQVVLPTEEELIRVRPARAAAVDPEGIERFPLTGPPPVVVQPG